MNCKNLLSLLLLISMFYFLSANVHCNYCLSIIDSNFIEYNEFDLNEFFMSKKDKNKKLEEISFDHEEFVQKWIYHIRDQYNETENNFNPHKKTPRFPFADKSFISYLKHTIWFLPDVSSCYAMKNLLQQEQNDFFNKNYKIILMAGNNAGVGVKAFQNHKEQLGNQHKTKT